MKGERPGGRVLAGGVAQQGACPSRGFIHRAVDRNNNREPQYCAEAAVGLSPARPSGEPQGQLWVYSLHPPLAAPSSNTPLTCSERNTVPPH
ncbi:unnamed protein product [Arctogadus glacialis]